MDQARLTRATALCAVTLVLALSGACRPTATVLTGEQRVGNLQIAVPPGWGAVWEPQSTLVLFPPDSRTTALRVSSLPATGAGAVLSQGAGQWLAATRTRDSVFVEGKHLIHIRFWVTSEAVFSLAQEVVSPTDSLRADYVRAAEHVVKTAQPR